MGTEVVASVNQVLEAIDKYMNGDKSYYNDILEVIDGLDEYIKHTKTNKRMTKLLIVLSKLVTSVFYKAVLEDERYHDILKNIDEDFKFYVSAVDSLKEYVEICAKTNKYPDLDIAYSLSIKLSIVFSGIMDYFKYIRSLESSYVSSITYIPADNYNEKNQEIIKEVDEDLKKLLFATSSIQ